MDPSDSTASSPHRRRPRYSGKNPRKFALKYKEHDPEKYSETVAKVLASGKTPAGAHRSIMVLEILGVLALQPGDLVADCTLGYGGHSLEILKQISPNGRLLGLDHDSIELPKTESRLRKLGFGADRFTAHLSNFAGLPKVLAIESIPALDCILADLGVSSMQIDDPARGFSVKLEGPLDMRMNPHRGDSAAQLIEKMNPSTLAKLLMENADEPHAELLADALAGQKITTTTALAKAIQIALPRVKEADLSVRRVFQALRIAVNDEFSALDSFLRILPTCLKPGGRVAILTFHSGEDRRVKKAFEAGLREGMYAEISNEVIRPTPEERHANPRSASAKLRWARRSCTKS